MKKTLTILFIIFCSVSFGQTGNDFFLVNSFEIINNGVLRYNYSSDNYLLFDKEQTSEILNVNNRVRSIVANRISKGLNQIIYDTTLVVFHNIPIYQNVTPTRRSASVVIKLSTLHILIFVNNNLCNGVLIEL